MRLGRGILSWAILLGAATAAWGEVPISVLEFPANKTEVTLKLERAGDLIFTRDIKINGKSVGLFLLDTGSRSSSFDLSIAEELTIPPQEIAEEGYAFSVVDIQLGSAMLRRHPFFGGALPRDAGIRVRGSIGDDILSRCPFCIDYRNNTLTLYSPEKFKPPEGVDRQPMVAIDPPKEQGPIERAFAHVTFPAIQLKLGGQRARVIMDTGQTYPLFLFPGFCADHPELIDVGRGTRGAIQTASLGPSTAYLPSFAELMIFGHRFPVTTDSVALYGDSVLPPARQPDAGVGTGILENFRVTVDLEHRQAWAEWRPLPTMAEQLKSGRDPNAADLSGRTPLLDAAMHGDIDAFNAIVAAGGKWDSVNFEHMTVLHGAAYGGCPAIVQRCLASGNLDIKARDDRGMTPLMYSMTWRDLACAKLLLGAGADVRLANKDGWTALHWAVSLDNLAAVQLLLDKPVEMEQLNNHGHTPLDMALLDSSPEMLEVLVGHGAKLDHRRPFNDSLLHLAAEGGNNRMIEYLLKKYPDRALVDSGNDGGITPLIEAAANGYPHAVELLLASGAKIDATAPAGNESTALHYAAHLGWTRVIWTLLKRGATVDARTNTGLTPLMVAAQSNQAGAAGVLLRGNSDIEATDRVGNTALTWACTNDAADCVRVLIDAHANVNVAVMAGARPLHLATVSGYADIVRLLLQAGADPNAKTAGGETPLDMARRMNKTNVIDALLNTTTRP